MIFFFFLHWKKQHLEAIREVQERLGIGQLNQIWMKTPPNAVPSSYLGSLICVVGVMPVFQQDKTHGGERVVVGWHLSVTSQSDRQSLENRSQQDDRPSLAQKDKKWHVLLLQTGFFCRLTSYTLHTATESHSGSSRAWVNQNKNLNAMPQLWKFLQALRNSPQLYAIQKCLIKSFCYRLLLGKKKRLAYRPRTISGWNWNREMTSLMNYSETLLVNEVDLSFQRTLKKKKKKLWWECKPKQAKSVSTY